MYFKRDNLYLAKVVVKNLFAVNQINIKIKKNKLTPS